MFKFKYKYPWAGLLFFEGEGESGGGGGGTPPAGGNPPAVTPHAGGQGTPLRRETAPAAAPRRDWTIEDYDRALAETRAESASRRIRLQDMEDNLTRANQAKDEAERKLAEQQAERDRASAARLGKVRQKAIDTELRAQAAAAGLRDLDLLALVDRKAIKFSDDDETIEGVTEALAAFKERKPEYFAAAGGGGGGGGGGGQNTNGGGGQNNGGGTRQSGSNTAPPPAGGTPSNVRQMTKEDAGKAHRAAIQQLRGLR